MVDSLDDIMESLDEVVVDDGKDDAKVGLARADAVRSSSFRTLSRWRPSYSSYRLPLSRLLSVRFILGYRVLEGTFDTGYRPGKRNGWQFNLNASIGTKNKFICLQ